MSVQYGIQVVICFVMIIFFAVILRWVFRFMDKLVTVSLSSVTTGLAALTESNNSAHHNQTLMGERISKDIKDGFDSMKQANIFQKDEHNRIVDRLQNLEKTFIEKMGDIECRATK